MIFSRWLLQTTAESQCHNARCKQVASTACPRASLFAHTPPIQLRYNNKHAAWHSTSQFDRLPAQFHTYNGTVSWAVWYLKYSAGRPSPPLPAALYSGAPPCSFRLQPRWPRYLSPGHVAQPCRPVSLSGVAQDQDGLAGLAKLLQGGEGGAAWGSVRVGMARSQSRVQWAQRPLLWTQGPFQLRARV